MTSMDHFTMPEINNYKQVLSLALAASRKKMPRAALIVPSDITSLKAMSVAALQGLVTPVLIGDEPLVRKNAEAGNISLDDFEILHLNEPDMAIQVGIKMAASRQLDILMNGRFPAVEFLKYLLDRAAGFVSTGRVISHVAVMKPALYRKLLFITDAAVNMEPNLRTKLALIENAVDVARSVGIDMPRVALLAAVDTIHLHAPVTLDAAIIAGMSRRNQINGAYVDGPLSFDVAVDGTAVSAKGLEGSPVAGQSDILVAPNIETANGVYRAMSLYGKADMGAIIYGGVVPVVLPSRSDSLETRLNSVALAILAAQKQPNNTKSAV